MDSAGGKGICVERSHEISRMSREWQNSAYERLVPWIHTTAAFYLQGKISPETMQTHTPPAGLSMGA